MERFGKSSSLRVSENHNRKDVSKCLNCLCRWLTIKLQLFERCLFKSNSSQPAKRCAVSWQKEGFTCYKLHGLAKTDIIRHVDYHQILFTSLFLFFCLTTDFNEGLNEVLYEVLHQFSMHQYPSIGADCGEESRGTDCALFTAAFSTKMDKTNVYLRHLACGKISAKLPLKKQKNKTRVWPQCVNSFRQTLLSFKSFQSKKPGSKKKEIMNRLCLFNPRERH